MSEKVTAMNGFEYIKIAAERGSKLGLERITELCERLGNPQNRTHIIHIAGTNGKGSFVAEQHRSRIADFEKIQ